MADGKRVLEALKAQLQNVPTRGPKGEAWYHALLFEGLTDVIVAEREHLMKATNIQVKVTDTCERLGDDLWRAEAGGADR